MNWYPLLEWLVLTAVVGGSAVYVLRRYAPRPVVSNKACNECKGCEKGGAA